MERVFVEGGTVHVTARTLDDFVVDCPGCGSAAHRVHSRYQRDLADEAGSPSKAKLQPVSARATAMRALSSKDENTFRLSSDLLRASQ
ncbi:hypothetical protein [Streptomyces europaeiscabiei]|uniref:hypothetical protein n=1 Tax=Streptomyces europaeiscabiei TaxID=146819 RepID=UPI0038D3DAB6